MKLVRSRRRLTQSDARFYASAIILGLQNLHQNGIVYRDLKSENVLIDETGYPKLVDFGLAINRNEKNRVQAPKNMFVGTLDYTAPEIFKRAEFKEEHDVWALGCLIYEMVIGVPPFHSSDPRKTV